ncbi:MAG TPA: hypothetical protein VGN98_08710, partial [Tianweitania sediminis]|nr:hypothetical protein [Tianweitania sediminis]
PSFAEIQYWDSELNSGNRNISDVAIAIAQSAQNEDAEILDAKVAAANQFTAAVQADADANAAYRGESGEAFGRAFLDQIDSSDDELTDEQVQAQVEAFGDGETNIPGIPGEMGEIFTFTNQSDNLVGTDADDTFRGPNGNTLQTVDSVDGGGGFDTLNALRTGGNITPVLVGVERINISATADSTLNLSDSTGVEEVFASDQYGTGGRLIVTGIDSSVTIGLRDTTAGGAPLAVQADFTDAAGSGDTANVELISADAGSLVVVGGMETVNVNTSGGSSFQLADAELETVNVTGSGALTLDIFAGSEANLESVNASGLNGGVTFTETVENDFEFIGGSGDDVISIGGATNEDFVIDTGAGNDDIYVGTATGETNITGGAGADAIQLFTSEDTLVYNAQSDSTFTNFDSITGFDVTEDQFDFSALNLTGEEDIIAANTTATTLGELAGGVTDLFSDGTDDYAVAYLQTGGDDFLLVDANNDGNFTSAADLVINVTGTDASTFTSANFTF